MPTYKGTIHTTTGPGGVFFTISYYLPPTPPFVLATTDTFAPVDPDMKAAVIAWAGSEVTLTTTAGPPETPVSVTK